MAAIWIDYRLATSGRQYAFDMMPESGHTIAAHVAADDDLDLRQL